MKYKVKSLYKYILMQIFDLNDQLIYLIYLLTYLETVVHVAQAAPQIDSVHR